MTSNLNRDLNVESLDLTDIETPNQGTPSQEEPRQSTPNQETSSQGNEQHHSNANHHGNDVDRKEDPTMMNMNNENNGNTKNNENNLNNMNDMNKEKNENNINNTIEDINNNINNNDTNIKSNNDFNNAINIDNVNNNTKNENNHFENKHMENNYNELIHTMQSREIQNIPTTPHSQDIQGNVDTSTNQRQSHHSHISKTLDKRLRALRFKLNQAREDNLQEVVKEKSHIRTRYSQKLTPSDKNAQSTNDEASRDRQAIEEGQSNEEGRAQEEAHSGVESKAPLNVTIAQAESIMQSLKRKRKNMAKEGWEMNQDRYRAMKRRSNRIPYTLNEYNEAMSSVSEESEGGMAPQLLNTSDREDYKNRMSSELQEYEEQRKKFNRRREFFEYENVNYINEKNRIYNIRTEKAYGKYTKELKQKLERGTNL